MGNIIQNYSFDHICGGFFRLISNPGLLQKYRKHIDPKWFFYNDNTDQVVALRKIIEISLSVDPKDLSVEFLAGQLYIKIGDEKTKQMVLAHYTNWKTSNSIRNIMLDDGCFSSFLEYLKLLNITKNASTLSQKYGSGDSSGAVETMHKIISGISDINASDYSVFDPEDLISQYENDHKNHGNLFTFGNSILDNDIGGGFNQQTLNLFISTTGGGKTALSHNIIRLCIEHKKHIFIAVLEDRQKSFRDKLVSCLTGIEVTALRRVAQKKASFTSIEIEKIKAAEKNIKEFVRAEFIYGANIDLIHNRMLEYDAECRSFGKPVPIVNMVDYTGHIAMKSSGDKGHEKIRNAYAARKDFVLAHNKIGFDFAQVNREGNKRLQDESRCLSHTDLAGAYDLSQVCDNIISLNRNAEDRDGNTSRFYISKARDGVVGYTYTFKVDFRCSRYDFVTCITDKPQFLQENSNETKKD
jgi:hypothetical protein